MYVIDLSRKKENVFSPLPTSMEDAFGPKNVETSCKVCRQMANVNLIECMKPEENHENKCCKFIYDTMKDAFELEWRNAPERYRGKNPTYVTCSPIEFFGNPPFDSSQRS